MGRVRRAGLVSARAGRASETPASRRTSRRDHIGEKIVSEARDREAQ
jgi:hypothetical protein